MKKKLFNLFIVLVFVLTSFSSFTSSSGIAKASDPDTIVTVEQAVLDEMETKGAASYWIQFKNTVDLSPAYTMNWSDRGWFVYKTLQKQADATQAQLKKYLSSSKVDFESYWINNSILVTSSTNTVLNEILKFDGVESIQARKTYILYEPDTSAAILDNSINAIEPNLTHINADDVWAMGIDGSGLVVANIDTGVRYSHQALVGQYRGNDGGTYDHNYNWWDPYGDHPTAPADDHGHGSHTMGTMVGDDGGSNQIGIAPGAEWIACRGCSTTDCSDAALLSCGQFVAAPTDLSGANANPDLRANAVNNSWGDCGQIYDSWYSGPINAWHAAGIYPIFSNGNSSNCGYSSPPGLNTVGNPARSGNVTGVGSSGEQNGLYATHSNWGPTDNLDTVNPVTGFENMKPQVIAPGVSIRSSVPYSDTSYEDGWTGTSMSAPHVTGLVALIWQAAPCLIGDYAATETLIESTAVDIVYDDSSPLTPSNFPNYATGWGEIDALAAVQLALTVCGPMGTLDGSVTAAGSGTPIAGALVQAVGAERTWQTYTDTAGYFSLPLAVDTYTVNFSAYGYMPATRSGIVISEGTTTTLNVALNLAPSYVVSGKVYDQDAGWGLYARITIDGYPGEPIWTDPATGNYSISLVAGQNYTFNANAFSAGYMPAAVDSGMLAGNLVLNIPVIADTDNCVAPGYELDLTGVYETFESATFPPAGWTVTQNGGTCTWVGDDPSGRGNLTGGTGQFAIADSDYCGNGSTMDTTLTSPIMNVSTLANVYLSYNYDYNNLSSNESADLDVSADGGATWTNVHHWNTDMRGPNTFTQDMTALLGGSTQAQVRFHYIAPGWDWWWEVDNVFVGEKDCHPIGGGGLVVGRVADAYDNHALVGAKVTSDTTAEATAVATVDPAMGNFYVLFQSAGNHSLTATMPQYSPATDTVSVPTGLAVRQDFALQTGRLSYTPNYIEETVSTGNSTTVQMTVQNIGGSPATFSLAEVNKGVVPFAQSLANAEPRTDLTVSAAPNPVQLTAGPWQPTGDISLVLDDGSMEDSIGVNDGVYAYQFIWMNRFTPAATDFPFTLDTVSVFWPTGQVAAGNAMQIVVYEDSDGDGNPSDATLLYAENVTVQSTGAWNDYTLTTPIALNGPGDVLIGLINRFVSSGVTAPNYPAALDETSSAGRSWIGWWSTDPPNPPVLPPDSTFIPIDSGGLPGNWMIRGSGVSGGVDVPWLSENPAANITLDPGASISIDVTLDNATLIPGVYTAEIKFVHNTPYTVPNLPVKMIASIPPTMGKLMGTVLTTGYCDLEQTPLAGVPVTVNSASFTEPLILTTAADGSYSVWLDLAASPLTIDVNAGPDYATDSATGVVLNGGQITFQDFTLRYLQPCLNAAPSSLLVTLPLGTSTTRPLTLRNNGGAAATFAFDNIATGYTAPTNAPLNQPATTITIGDLTFSADPTPPKESSDPNAGDARKVIAGSATITQSNSQTIMSGNSASCSAGGLHTDNHYLRVFDLPAFGISGDFAITNVSFGIEGSVPTGSTQPVEVHLFTLNGDFVFANLTPIGSATAAVTSQTLTILDVPVTGIAPAGSQLVVDIFTPNGQTAGHSFYIGSNGLGETGPSYLAAADCGIPEPATTASVGFPEMMIVMNVTGEAEGFMSGPAIWLSEMPPDGTVVSDGMLPVVVTFDASKVNAPGTYQASAMVNSNDPQNQALDVQTTMVVTAPANWGVLQGTISGLGYCDADPALLSGATVLVTGSGGITRTATTGANGSYEFWLPDYASPYTLQVTETDHLDATASDIMVVAMGTTTQDMNLRLAQPCVTETPPEISETLEWQQSATVQMTLTNSGAVPTPFTITEISGTFTPMGIMGNQILIVNDGGGNTTPTNAFKTAMDNLGYTSDVVSSSQMTGIPATMTNYMAVLYAGVPSSGEEIDQLVAYLEAGGNLLIADNDFGYSDQSTTLYQTYLQATYVSDAGSDGPIHGVDIMAGTDADISSDPYPDSFTIGPDAVGIFANTSPLSNWAGMRIARNAYKAVYFAWDYHNAGGSNVGDAIETEIMSKVMPWLMPADVDWLTAAPDQGTLAADTGLQAVQVTLNSAAASVLQPGTYTAQLKIETNDPVTETIFVPVTMIVNPSSTYGKLWGTVNGLGACDLDPAPIANAQVSILTGTETITVETDANGYYQYWFTAADPTINLQVTADGHLEDNREVSFWPGADTRNQQDFDLHWLQPCGAFTPDSLSAELMIGASTTLPAEIANSGWAPLNFSFRPKSTGFIPMGGTTAGEDVLLVASNSTVADAVAASLTRLGFTFNQVTTSTLPPVSTWTDYLAVIWAGSPSNTTNTSYIKSYLDAGGSFLISYNDFGYSFNTDTLYTDYLEAAYITDSGSDGTITGADIMTGLNIDISADPYPDSFTITGSNAVAIFTNDAPNTDLSGLRIAKDGYQAIYLSWNFQYTGTTDADKDAVLGNAMNWLAPGITWVQADPVSGTVADNAQQAVVVTLNAGDPAITQPGTYLADLNMRNNTPGNNIISIPVTMIVNPPGTWGKLQGTVTSLGFCDANPAPLVDVLVTISPAVGAPIELKTDADGYYTYWFNQADSPVSIAVNPADHLAGAATATITAGATTTQDFTLRLDAPCLSILPTELEQTQLTNKLTQHTLQICNNGAGSMLWKLIEAEDPITVLQSPELTLEPVLKEYTLHYLPDGSIDCGYYANYTGFELAEVAKSCGSPQSILQASVPTGPTDIGYALDIGSVSDNFVSFPLNNFTGQTVVGTNPTTFYGMDFDASGTVLYALDDSTDQLGTIDLTTGAFTGLVACPPGGGVANWTGLSIDPTTDEFYASTATALYTINPSTGVSTLVGSFGTNIMIDIAINADGEMYGHDIETDSIYSIDMVTGAATLIGSTGYGANFAQGMDFDNNDGTLYIFLYQGSGANVYGTVNLSTGAVTPLAVSAPQGEFEGAIPISGPQVEIPWVSEDLLAGTLEGDSCTEVTVTFDSTGLAVGDYTGFLRIKYPPAVPGEVSLTLHVTDIRDLYLPLILK